MRVFFLYMSLFLGMLSFAQPANDNCANAIDLVVNAPYNLFSTTNAATTQVGEYCAS
jgi:hypothetical protein